MKKLNHHEITVEILNLNESFLGQLAAAAGRGIKNKLQRDLPTISRGVEAIYKSYKGARISDPKYVVKNTLKKIPSHFKNVKIEGEQKLNNKDIVVSFSCIFYQETSASQQKTEVNAKGHMVIRKQTDRAASTDNMWSYVEIRLFKV